jgi:hypothetical protein
MGVGSAWEIASEHGDGRQKDIIFVLLFLHLSITTPCKFDHIVWCKRKIPN